MSDTINNLSLDKRTLSLTKHTFPLLPINPFLLTEREENLQNYKHELRQCIENSEGDDSKVAADRIIEAANHSSMVDVVLSNLPLEMVQIIRNYTHETVDLSYLELTYLPRLDGNLLQNAEVLKIGAVPLEEVPDLGHLTQLKELDLSGCDNLRGLSRLLPNVNVIGFERDHLD